MKSVKIAVLPGDGIGPEIWKVTRPVLDAAMKAINPAYSGKEKFPIITPNFNRDFALHFAIGYPF